jgi:peroxiredoxin
MSPRLLLAALIVFSPFARALAQESAPAAAPAEAPAEPASGPTADFEALFGRIKTKLQAGQHSEEELAPELKDFDAILAKYAAQKSDEVAMVAVMKARLYIEVFEDLGKGLALLQQVKTDFPATKVAEHLDGPIEAITKQLTRTTALAIGQPFPAFAEQDLDGKPLSLEQYQGKVVLVDFWATWCGPCKEELPNVIAAYQKYHARGFEIIGISLDKSREDLTEFIKEENMPWAQYFDGLGWKNKLAQQYGIDSIPATFLVGADGKIVAKNLRGPALEKKLAALLGE